MDPLTPPPPQRPVSLEELSALALGHNGPEAMPLAQLYLRIDGRIARRQFWLHGVLALILAAVFGNALLDIAGLENDAAGKLVNLILAWPLIAVSAKRLHDFNFSAWWMLVNFVPAVGSLAMLVILGCVPGTRGPNRYGDDPRVRTANRFLNIVH